MQKCTFRFVPFTQLRVTLYQIWGYRYGREEIFSEISIKCEHLTLVTMVAPLFNLPFGVKAKYCFALSLTKKCWLHFWHWRFHHGFQLWPMYNHIFFHWSCPFRLGRLNVFWRCPFAFKAKLAFGFVWPGRCYLDLPNLTIDIWLLNFISIARHKFLTWSTFLSSMMVLADTFGSFWHKSALKTLDLNFDISCHGNHILFFYSYYITIINMYSVSVNSMCHPPLHNPLSLIWLLTFDLSIWRSGRHRYSSCGTITNRPQHLVNSQ